jgi:hypothetical protein
MTTHPHRSPICDACWRHARKPTGGDSQLRLPSSYRARGRMLLMSRRCTTRGLQNATLLGLGLRVFAVPPRRFPSVWSCRGTRVALQLAQLASSLPACLTPRRGGTRQKSAATPSRAVRRSFHRSARIQYYA